MGILDELRAEEGKLRGIKAPRGEGAGHAFGKSKLAKLVSGERTSAPPKIYAENMASEAKDGEQSE